MAVRDGRRLSFAEFGTPRGAAVVWLHGTPGSRRQIPLEARRYADEHDLRIIGIDRPGIGTSTPHLYRDVLDWTPDLAILADTLGVDTMRVIGLSGGGPYALAAGFALPDRVRGVGVLGGVVPLVGPDAIRGGLMGIAPYAAPVLSMARVPLSIVLAGAVRLVRPWTGSVIDGWARIQPRADRELLGRPEFRAMFLDDLRNGTRFQVAAPLSDIILFTRDWGFPVGDLRVGVKWWHGDGDHIIPHAHGQYVASRIPGATFETIHGESHLGGMGVATQVLDDLLQLGERPVGRRSDRDRPLPMTPDESPRRVPLR